MTAKQFYNFHRSLFENWEYGEIEETWKDADGNICIKYTSGNWWHYSVNEQGIIFW